MCCGKTSPARFPPAVDRPRAGTAGHGVAPVCPLVYGGGGQAGLRAIFGHWERERESTALSQPRTLRPEAPAHRLDSPTVHFLSGYSAYVQLRLSRLAYACAKTGLWRLASARRKDR